MIIRILIFWGLSNVIAVAKVGDYVVLESSNGHEPQVVAGDPAQLERSVSPASTFKMIISWAGLEEGLVEPGSMRRVTERHIPRTPREVSLHEAMYYSSNSYFIELAQKIGETKMAAYMRQADVSVDVVPEQWLEGGWSSAKKGGFIKVSATKQHEFVKNILEGNIGSSADKNKQLMQVMEWPSGVDNIKLYGKTGVWGGAVWFNGFGVIQDKDESGKEKITKKAVTVLYEGSIGQRSQAIAAFYDRFGLKPVEPKQSFFMQKNK
ncbi:MAG: penicillin-binding transpeptidase domain-containing protein [Verrucomicrobiota bacterium]